MSVEAIDRLATRLRGSGDVVAATLYGSYVRGGYDAATSDINLAVVVRGDDLSRIAPALQDGWRAARIDPWIARVDELPSLADVFATRVRDIQRAHRQLVGEDVWAALVIDRAALRLRIEQELRNHQIRLRRAQVLGDATSIAHQEHATRVALRLDLALLAELAGRELDLATDAPLAHLLDRAVALADSLEVT